MKFGTPCQRRSVWPYIIPSRNMPVLICLRKELWTGLISVGDQVPTCPVFTRAKNKVPFWDFSHFAVTVCSGFLGNTRMPHYQACIEKLLKSYEDMGCRMSLKIHFLLSHLNFFLPNLGAMSDEHGERFHQDITKMESNYQGKRNPSIMGDFCWMLLRNIPEAKYTRSSKKTHFWLSVVLWIV